MSKAKKAVKKVVKKKRVNGLSDNTIRVLSLFRSGKTLSPMSVYEKVNKKKEVMSHKNLSFLLYKLAEKGVLDKAGRGLYVKGKNAPEKYAKYIA